MLKFFSKRMNNKKGFTLIELIVVIAILAILALIAVPRIGKFRTRAANSSHNANVRTLMGAASTYLAEKGEARTDDDFPWEENTGAWSNYINKWPTPPKGAEYASTDLENDNKPKPYKVEISNSEITVTPGLIEVDDE